MNKQIRTMMRDPNALVRFHTTGKLPPLFDSEDTPLRQLILKIPVRYWSLFKGVRLSHELGFNSAMQFGNIHQLSRYLGTNKKVARSERLAYQFYIDRGVKLVTLAQLIESSAEHPTQQALADIIKRLPPHLVGHIE